MFCGYVAIDSALKAPFIVRDSSSIPANATALPAHRIYGPAGIMTGGTGSLAFKDTGSVTGATNANPIVISSAGHKLSTGNRVTITGVTGNTAANTTAAITVVNSNSFSLDAIAGNGAYLSGGTWNVSGLYDFSVTPTLANGYEVGQMYSVFVTYVIGGVTKVDQRTFGVV